MSKQTRTSRPGRTGVFLLTAACGLMAGLPAHAAETATQEVQRLRAQLEAQMKVSQAIQARLDALEAREAADAKAQAETKVQAEQVAAQAATQAKTIAKLEASSGDNGSFTMAGGRPTFTAFGGKGTLQIGLQAQFDAAAYFEDNASVKRSGVDLGDGVNARRIRIPFVFRYGDVTATVTPDFGGSPDGRQNTQYLYEANLAYMPFKGFTAALGYLQPNISLQDAPSSNDFMFMERPAIMDVERNIAAGDARAAVGARYYQDRFFVSGFLTGQAYGGQSTTTATSSIGSTGSVTTAISTTQPSNGQQTGAVMRVAGRPVYGEDYDVHLGFSGSKVFSMNQNDSNRLAQNLALSVQPELRVDTSKLINTGSMPATGVYTWNPEVGLRYQNFLVQAEYVEIGINRQHQAGAGLGGASQTPDLTFQGAYVDASWVLTGEPRLYQSARGGFGGLKVAHPFNPETNDWGALELAARYSDINLNSHVQRFLAQSVTGGVAGGQQDVIQVGLNWYPNDHLKFMADYQIVDVSKLSGATLQNQTGLRYQAVGFRAQVAY
ncbi:OprO/OprP family phosphate-selective porin [Nitrospirillum pindoramense]|uniref:Phosphate-selective porin OprO/OprP n=1 Tax=Nitrospirillum amazonense TaxID=28077 RepID=A0A560HBM4_9PROT|nr:porin [Nitrospirillum amazonense]TWB43767.1 phosphate-selective porin OprO/OprP [Nitrospirillum amazonense]